jgi:hypothetical protein
MKTQNSLLYILGLGVVLALMLLALVAHAESIMSPIDDRGQNAVRVDRHARAEVGMATPPHDHALRRHELPAGDAKLGARLRQASAPAAAPPFRFCDRNRHEQWRKLVAGPVPGASWRALSLLGTRSRPQPASLILRHGTRPHGRSHRLSHLVPD